MMKYLARFVSERFLINHGCWDECDGEPMNVWAEEFVRRDQKTISSMRSEDGKGGKL